MKPGRVPPCRKIAPTLGARTDDFQHVGSSGCAIGLLQAAVLTGRAVKQIVSSAVTFVIAGHKPQAAWPGSRRENCTNIPVLEVISKILPQLGCPREDREWFTGKGGSSQHSARRTWGHGKLLLRSSASSSASPRYKQEFSDNTSAHIHREKGSRLKEGVWCTC